MNEPKGWVNLGCPSYCDNYVCVDLKPKDDSVIKCEAVQFLREQKAESIYRIKSNNLIEHLLNVGEFFHVAYESLAKGGVLMIRTDNAEFLPFYIPVIHRLGFAAHCSDRYDPKIMNGSRHYCLFTKLHLEHYAKYYGFSIISMNRDKATLGARLNAVLQK